MTAKNLFVYNCCYRETIKTISENFPQFNGIFFFTLIIKTINSIDSRTFVVTPQQKKVFWVSDFISQKKSNCFNALSASIDIISKKKIIRVWWISAILEQSQQIVVLSMDISAYLQARFQLQQNWLGKKYFPTLLTQPNYFFFRQIDSFSRFGTSHFQ